MRNVFLAAALLLAGCGQADRTAAPTPAPTAAATAAAVPDAADAMARYDGYGDLWFGMDEAAFATAWGGALNGAAQAGSDCFYKTPQWVKRPADFAFMFEGGRFVRYDVGTAKETAPGGGKVGMDVAQIRALYGERIQSQPHKYVVGASYLRIATPQGESALVFETDAQGKVTHWRVGVPPQVDYVEGCG
jgi:hypothetical protein